MPSWLGREMHMMLTRGPSPDINNHLICTGFTVLALGPGFRPIIIIIICKGSLFWL